jgi:hypothetical protein
MSVGRARDGPGRAAGRAARPGLGAPLDHQGRPRGEEGMASGARYGALSGRATEPWPERTTHRISDRPDHLLKFARLKPESYW